MKASEVVVVNREVVVEKVQVEIDQHMKHLHLRRTESVGKMITE